MKSDSVVPSDDSQQEHGIATDEPICDATGLSEAVKGVSSHDLRASLAIVNGFSAALAASFQDLSDQYSQILESSDDAFITESADRLMMLDADCRFCLSRLHTSIDQLKQRIQSDQVMMSTGQQEKTDQ